jgi:CRISPR-associated protein Cas1
MAATSVVYVDEPGARLRKEQGRILVQKGDENLAEILLDHLEQLILIDAVDCTGSALMSLLRAGVDVCFVDFYGRYRGRVTSDLPRNCGLRLAQFDVFRDAERRLDYTKLWLRAKVENGRTLLMRLGRTRDALDLRPLTDAMGGLSQQIAETDGLDAARGLEGRAAHLYFQGLGRLLHPPWELTGRLKHPAPDPVNALLSLGYGLLRRCVETSVALSGLDPTIGFLHEPHPGRFSLALDLMEEFRPILADSAALLFLNRGQVKPDEFETTSEGMLLKEAARSRFFHLFEERLEAVTVHPATGERATYRRHLDGQARMLARAVQGVGEYQPFAVR